MLWRLSFLSILPFLTSICFHKLQKKLKNKMLFSPHCLREDIIIQSNFLFVANDMVVKFSFVQQIPHFIVGEQSGSMNRAKNLFFLPLVVFPVTPLKIKIKIVYQIKSRIWEMIEGKYGRIRFRSMQCFQWELCFSQIYRALWVL